MNILNKIRFPYSSDKLFSVVFLLIIFVPLAFAPGLSDPYEGLKFSLYSIFLGIALIIFLANSTDLKINSKIAITLVVFFLWSLFSAITSLDIITSIIELNIRFTSSVYFYGLWVISILIFWQTLTYEKVTFLLKGLVGSSVAIALLEILQSFGVAHYEGINAGVRPILPSFLGNPNFSSMFIAALLPVSIILGIQAKIKSTQLYYIVSTILILWGVALSSSRGSMLAVVIELIALGLISIFYWKKQILPIALTGLIAGLLFFGFYSAFRPDSTSQTFALSERTVQSRFVAWDQVIKIMTEYPFFGTGPGNLINAYHSFSPSAFAAEQVFDDAHNVFLHLGVVGGIPLLLSFALILGFCFYYAYQHPFKQKDMLHTAVLVGLLGLVISMNFNPVVVGCWVLLASFVTFLTFNDLDRNLKLTRTFQIIIGSIAVIFIFIGLLVLTSSILAKSSIHAYMTMDYSNSYKYGKMAVSLNPFRTDILSYFIAAGIRENVDPVETDRLIQRYIYIQPNKFETYLNISTLQVMRYDLTQDKKYLSSSYSYIDLAEEKAPNFGILQTKKAYLHFITGDLTVAKQSLNKALSIDNENYYNWVLRAKIAQIQNQKEEMIFSLEKAQSIKQSEFIKKILDSANKEVDVHKIEFSIYFPRIDITR